MTLTRAPSGTRGKTREELEQMISDLRRDLKAARHIIALRERRSLARQAPTPRIDGKPLRAAREAVGWKVSDVADALPTCRTNVHNWEAGRNRMPRKTAFDLIEMFKRQGVEPPAFDLSGGGE